MNGPENLSAADGYSERRVKMKSKLSHDKSPLKAYFLWYGIVSGFLILAGLIFSIFGFSMFPDRILPRSVLLSWESSIYGAVLIGWGTMLFFLLRLSFRRIDPELMKIMLLGIAVWLIVEAFFSAYLGVYFNVGVDFAVLILFSIPSIKIIRYLKQESAQNHPNIYDVSG